MGTFEGHILPGVFFLSIGLWHLYNILRLNCGGHYKGRKPWFYARLPGMWKRIELFGIMFGAGLSIASELFIFPKRHHPFDDGWIIGSSHLNNFEHSTMSLFFLLYGAVALIEDATDWLALPHGVLHLVGSAAFFQELMLFHLHSTDHMGLEGQYHTLLQLPIILGLFATGLELVYPTSVLPPLVRATALIDQGLWMFQTAFTLWIPAFAPLGCPLTADGSHKVVKCHDPASDFRAKALANLYFSWYFALCIVFVIAALALANGRRGGRGYKAIAVHPLPIHHGDVDLGARAEDASPVRGHGPSLGGGGGAEASPGGGAGCGCKGKESPGGEGCGKGCLRAHGGFAEEKYALDGCVVKVVVEDPWDGRGSEGSSGSEEAALSSAGGGSGQMEGFPKLSRGR